MVVSLFFSGGGGIHHPPSNVGLINSWIAIIIVTTQFEHIFQLCNICRLTVFIQKYPITFVMYECTTLEPWLPGSHCVMEQVLILLGFYGVCGKKFTNWGGGRSLSLSELHHSSSHQSPDHDHYLQFTVHSCTLQTQRTPQYKYWICCLF